MLAKIKQICILKLNFKSCNYGKNQTKYQLIFFSQIVRNSNTNFYFWFWRGSNIFFHFKACKNIINFASSKLWIIPLSSKMLTYLMIESLYLWNEIRYIYIAFRILWCFLRLSFAPVRFANRNNSSKIEIAMETE